MALGYLPHSMIACLFGFPYIYLLSTSPNQLIFDARIYPYTKFTMSRIYQLSRALQHSRIGALRPGSSLLPARPSRRCGFSTSAARPLMELTGFTEEQLTVRDAVSAICAKFPNTYWQECDQNERDPKEFHAALARDGWLGIALPEELGGAGLGRPIPPTLATLHD